MMKVLKTVFFFLLVVLSKNLIGQGSSFKVIRPLTIGDIVPDIEINNIINYPTTSAKISDFQGKLLILDFWATWCSPCVKAFPRLDSLQKKYNGKIQILSVTDEEKYKVVDFLDRFKTAKNVLPTTVTNDKVLRRYFKHVYIPHYVWLNGNGKIIAITQSEDVNEVNIAKAIQGESFSYLPKIDPIRKVVGSFRPSIQIKTDNSTDLQKIPDSSLVIYSLLTKYIEGGEPGCQFADSTGIQASNYSIQNLYKIALMGNSLSLLNVNTIISEIKDPVLYGKLEARTLDGKELSPGLESLAWKRENGYCYELKVPPSLAKQRFNIMLSELNRYFGFLFGIEGALETRRTKYLALVQINNENKFASNGGESNIERNQFLLKLNNVPLRTIIGELAIPLQTYPLLIDESNFIGNVDMQLNCQLSDLEAVKNELNRYGLDIQLKEKDISVGVLRKKAINGGQ